MVNFNFFFLFLFFLNFQNILSLDNGLALKPPMGWLAWARYTCNTDCIRYPDDCINENLFYRQADILAKEFLQYGYEYICIDDCWSEMFRNNVTNELIADRKRFPNGIKKLADRIHLKGLKIGIYSDIGTETCQGYPGHQDKNKKGKFYFDIDAKTFAHWGIDYLKVDGCNANTSEYANTYPALTQALNNSGRSIVYSCSWPAYMIDEQEKKTLDFNRIATSCNVWRNYDDISFSWMSVTSIIDFYAKHQDEYVEIHGPGQWFDADMIIVGNNGLSLEQMKAQMAIWSIWSAPLFISADLTTIKMEEKKILTNKHVISINQDDQSIFGRRVYKKQNFEIWLKPLTPISYKNTDFYQYAVVFFNREVLGSPKYFSRTIQDLIIGYKKNNFYNPDKELKKHFEQAIVYKVIDLFDDGADIGRVHINQNLTLKVNVAGAVRMVKLIPLQY